MKPIFAKMLDGSILKRGEDGLYTLINSAGFSKRVSSDAAVDYLFNELSRVNSEYTDTVTEYANKFGILQKEVEEYQRSAERQKARIEKVKIN